MCLMIKNYNTRMEKFGLRNRPTRFHLLNF